jgi:hypothetical protein
MEPATLIAGAIALVFALLAMLQWRRATDLEERVRELEGKLADAQPSPRELGAAAPTPEPPPAAPEPEPAPEAAEEPAPAAPEPEPTAEQAAEQPGALDEVAPIADLPPVEPTDDPASARASNAATAPSSGAPESMRLAALEVVAQAFEQARYLDFDFIVEKPSTYRVPVPITAANGKAVRHLEAGMFPCLAAVHIEGSEAVLHIDTAKGPP